MRHSANILNHPVTPQISGSVNGQIMVQSVQRNDSYGKSVHFRVNKETNKQKSLLHQVAAKLSNMGATICAGIVFTDN